MKRLPVRVAVLGVHAYRVLVSPLFAPSCRFLPTCSEYAEDALRTRGLVRGAMLTLGRLLRCHPFCAGGLDPVPPSRPGEHGPVEPSCPGEHGPVEHRGGAERPREKRTPR